MIHKIAVVCLILLAVMALCGVAYFFLLKKPERWAVYYTNVLPADTFKPYHVIAFDRDNHPPLATLISPDRVLLGYISLGEAETYRSNYQTVQDKNLILATGDEWKGNPIIDTRNPEWAKYVLDELIPEILKQGFDGIMIDTVDSIIWLENTYPGKYPGLKKAMVGLIKSIHIRYPAMKIMLNRGFDILPMVAGDIDMFLAESTLTTLNAESKTFYFLPTKEREDYLRKLYDAQRKAPRLKIYTIDYWDMKDVENIKRMYHEQRRAGFLPYVSTMDLQSHTPEPQ